MYTNKDEVLANIRYCNSNGGMSNPKYEVEINKDFKKFKEFMKYLDKQEFIIDRLSEIVLIGNNNDL